MTERIKTYEDLLQALKLMTPDQLKQVVQVAKDQSCADEPVPLQPGIAIGTVHEMGFEGTRSSVDNKYHGEEVVILIDSNGFSKTGAIAYDLTDSWEDLEDNPIYGKDGPTRREDQMRPDRLAHPLERPHVYQTIQHRSEQVLDQWDKSQ